MKKLYKVISSLFTIKTLINLFIILLMAYGFIDCTCKFFKMFHYSVQFFGLSIFVLIYFFLIYWKESDKFMMTQEQSKYFTILKIIILTFLILPVGNEIFEKALFLTNLEISEHLKKSYEIFQIIGIELATKVLFIMLRLCKIITK